MVATRAGAYVLHEGCARAYDNAAVAASSVGCGVDEVG